MRRCGPTPTLIIFVAYAPKSGYEEEVEAFYMELEKFYREDHAFYKVIVGDFSAKIGPRRRLRNFEEEVEAFCTDLKKFYREDHVYKGTAGDFNADWPQKNTWRTSHRNLRPSME